MSRMMETLKSVTAIVAFFALWVVLAIGLLKFKDLIEDWYWARRARRQPERQPGTPEYTARLLDPRMEELEAHFGRPLQRAFKILHQDAELLRRAGFYIAPPSAREFTDTWHIAHFLPADIAALSEVFPVGRQNMPIATDGFGDVYTLALTEGGADACPVYLSHHDGDDRERVASSPSEFLSWRRLNLDEAETLGR